MATETYVIGEYRRSSDGSPCSMPGVAVRVDAAPILGGLRTRVRVTLLLNDEVLTQRCPAGAPIMGCDSSNTAEYIRAGKVYEAILDYPATPLEALRAVLPGREEQLHDRWRLVTTEAPYWDGHQQQTA